MQNRISGRDGPIANGTDSANLAALLTRLRSNDAQMIQIASWINSEAPTLGNAATLWTSNGLDTTDYIGTVADSTVGEYYRTRFPWLMLTLTSDQDSAVGGVLMECNVADGPYWQTAGSAQTYLTADGTTSYVWRRVCPRMRLKYTGGGVTPTLFAAKLFMLRTNPGI